MRKALCLTASILIAATCIAGVRTGSNLGRGGSVNRFAPTDIADALAGIGFTVRLQTWKPGTSGALGLYKDTACTIPATTAGDAVAAWRDEITGTAFVVSQATAGNRPVRGTSSAGTPDLVFVSANNNYLTGALTVAQPDTIFVLGRTDTASSAFRFVDGSTTRQLIGSGGSGITQFYAGGNLTGGLYPVSQYYTATGIFNSTTSTFRSNGYPRVTGSVGGNALNGLIIGHDSGGSLPLNGRVSAVLIYPGVASASVIATVESYFATLQTVPYLVTTVTGSLSAVNYTILRPSNANGSLVLYAHGAGETETALTTDTLKNEVVNTLLQNGYTVAASAAAGNNWGNQAGVNAISALASYVETTYGTNKTVVFSQSMGGLAGLTAIKQGLIPHLVGWFGIYPATNLSNMFANTGSPYHAQIRTAYGIASDDSDYSTKTAGYDPNLFAGSVFTGLRMRFYASSSDTIVNKAANTTAMAALVSGYATENTVVDTTGDHGDPSNFQPSDTLTFVNRCTQ